MSKTKVFASLVLVLILSTYYFEFYSPKVDEEKKGQESRIVPDLPEQIHQVQVENAKGKLLLRRDSEGWTLVEPLQDWADNQFVEDFVSGLANEINLGVAVEGDQIDWAMYGLDTNFSRVLFKNQLGKEIEIQISTKKNFEGNSFLRRNSEKRVLIASSQWSMRGQNTVIDFRDKRLYRGKIGSVDEISIKSPKTDLVIVKKDSKWINLKSPDINLDQNKIREFLTSLNEIQAKEFLTSIPKSQIKANITLKAGDKTWVAEISESNDKSIYVSTKAPLFLLKLERGKVEEFFAMTLQSLRDRHAPFDFKNLLVHEIEVETPLKKWSVKKEKDGWRTSGENTSPMEEKQVRNLITRLSESAVTEYLEKGDQRQFVASNKLLLRGESGEELFRLSWGGPIKRKALVGEKEFVLAKTDLFADVFALDPSVVESWGLSNLVQGSSQKTEPKKEVQ